MFRCPGPLLRPATGAAFAARVVDCTAALNLGRFLDLVRPESLRSDDDRNALLDRFGRIRSPRSERSTERGVASASRKAKPGDSCRPQMMHDIERSAGL